MIRLAVHGNLLLVVLTTLAYWIQLLLPMAFVEVKSMSLAIELGILMVLDPGHLAATSEQLKFLPDLMHLNISVLTQQALHFALLQVHAMVAYWLLSIAYKFLIWHRQTGRILHLIILQAHHICNIQLKSVLIQSLHTRNIDLELELRMTMVLLIGRQHQPLLVLLYHQHPYSQLRSKYNQPRHQFSSNGTNQLMM